MYVSILMFIRCIIWQAIRKVGRKMTTNTAVSPANVGKNRYTNILPCEFDHFFFVISVTVLCYFLSSLCLPLNPATLYVYHSYYYVILCSIPAFPCEMLRLNSTFKRKVFVVVQWIYFNSLYKFVLRPAAVAHWRGRQHSIKQ